MTVRVLELNAIIKYISFVRYLVYEVNVYLLWNKVYNITNVKDTTFISYT